MAVHKSNFRGAWVRSLSARFNEASSVRPTHWLISVQVGGIVVHNNWQYTSARAAVVDFRRDRGLEHLPLHLVDGNAMAWIKEA